MPKYAFPRRGLSLAILWCFLCSPFTWAEDTEGQIVTDDCVYCDSGNDLEAQLLQGIEVAQKHGDCETTEGRFEAIEIGSSCIIDYLRTHPNALKLAFHSQDPEAKTYYSHQLLYAEDGSSWYELADLIFGRNDFTWFQLAYDEDEAGLTPSQFALMNASEPNDLRLIIEMLRLSPDNSPKDGLPSTGTDKTKKGNLTNSLCPGNTPYGMESIFELIDPSEIKHMMQVKVSSLDKAKQPTQKSLELFYEFLDQKACPK